MEALLSRTPAVVAGAVWSLMLVSVALPAHAQKDGDLWEVATEMSVPGMPAGMKMPGGQTRNVCAKRGGGNERPPVSDNERCEMYDMKRSGNSWSWKMRCQGDPPTTGSGDIVYEGRDRYRGTINMDAGGQKMTMKLQGRRVGDCDYAAQQAQVQQQVASVQRQQQQVSEQMCAGGVKNMMSMYLRPDSPYQCGQKYKTEFCARLQTQEGFALVAQRRPTGVAGMPSGDLQEASEFCGVNGADLRERLCRSAEKTESLEFLGTSCVGHGTPGYGQAIAARECAGRTFSSPPAEKYRGFCSAVVRAGLMKPAAADAAKGAARADAKPADKPAEKPAESTQDSAVEAGKRLLKGILGR